MKIVIAFLLPTLLIAQSSPELQQILERLQRLENENRALAEEVRALRRELAAGRAEAPLEEKVEVQEKRIEEQAQTKVEASQRFPIRISGMALFNAFLNSKGAAGADNPSIVPIGPGPATGGATLRQSVIGLNYQGPETLWNGKLSGSLFMDFFAGTSQPLNNLMRIRIASIQVDWQTRTLMVGQEKPLISKREPNSLSQVGVSPLTNSGNLWLWQPQVRFEQRFTISGETSIRAQAAVYQTSEASASVPPAFASTLERARPALQGRLEIARQIGEGRRIEIAPGFHTSSTHVAGTSVDSNLVSFDWFLNPWSRLEFSGMFFSGQNVANMGALRQGFTILDSGRVIPVHSRGGWAQITLLPTSRLSLNFYGGQQDDRDSDLRPGGFGKNQSYAGNIMYRLAPNVIMSFETAHVRTSYLGTGTRLNNHYDLALGYLF